MSDSYNYSYISGRKNCYLGQCTWHKRWCLQKFVLSRYAFQGKRKIKCILTIYKDVDASILSQFFEYDLTFSKPIFRGISNFYTFFSQNYCVTQHSRKNIISQFAPCVRLYSNVGLRAMIFNNTSSRNWESYYIA